MSAIPKLDRNDFSFEVNESDLILNKDAHKLVERFGKKLVNAGYTVSHWMDMSSMKIKFHCVRKS